ncbi:unnamed protein product [Umbelopsis sp. WA50703]
MSWPLPFIPRFNSTLTRRQAVYHATNETYLDRIAAFGPRISEDGIYGFLIEPSDRSGCTIVQPERSEKWIALVERGGCSFIEKVRNMQRSGAIAVAVGDPDHVGWTTMFAPGDTSDVQIPSVFLSQHEYLALLYLSKLFSTPMLVQLLPDDLLTWPLLDVLVIVILSPSIMMIFIYISWRVRQRQRRQKDLAPQNVVTNLPVKIFRQVERKENEPEECAICLEDYVDGEELRILPCRHEFHVGCVDAWLTTRKKFCPICKRNVMDDNSTEATPLLDV